MDIESAIAAIEAGEADGRLSQIARAARKRNRNIARAAVSASGCFGPGMPWGETVQLKEPDDMPRFGLVVFNAGGEVLLREVKGHYHGSTWTFAKGGQEGSEAPQETAVREAAEELGYEFDPVAYIPGAWEGSGSTSYYYLALDDGARYVPERDNGETVQIRWVAPARARDLIRTSESEAVVERDLGVLAAAARVLADLERFRRNSL